MFRKSSEDAFKSYVMKRRVKTTGVQKAFKSFANSFTLINEECTVYPKKGGLSRKQKPFLAEVNMVNEYLKNLSDAIHIFQTI